MLEFDVYAYVGTSLHEFYCVFILKLSLQAWNINFLPRNSCGVGSFNNSFVMVAWDYKIILVWKYE